MAYDLHYDPGLEDELARLGDQDRAAFYALWDALEESEALRELLEVERNDHYPNPQFNNEPVQQLLQMGYWIYRIKQIRPNGKPHEFRVLFALDHRRHRIWFLALMPRTENYVPTAPTVSQALLRYQALGLPLGC